MGDVRVDKFGSRMALSGNVEAITLNFDIDKMLELQEKYTTLQMECRRLFEFVQSSKNGGCDVLLGLSNEHLSMIANDIFADFRPLTNEERRERIKNIREYAERLKGGDK